MQADWEKLNELVGRCMNFVKYNGINPHREIIDGRWVYFVMEYVGRGLFIETKSDTQLFICCMVRVWDNGQPVLNAGAVYSSGRASNANASFYVPGDWEQKI